MNYKACRGKYVVCVKVENRRYFYTVTSDETKAQRIAEKIRGYIVYVDWEILKNLSFF